MNLKQDKDRIVFCQNVKKLRERYFLSQKEMADKLKISKKELRKTEKGILPDSVTVELLFLIQKYFAIAPKDMFDPL